MLCFSTLDSASLCFGLRCWSWLLDCRHFTPSFDRIRRSLFHTPAANQRLICHSRAASTLGTSGTSGTRGTSGTSRYFKYFLLSIPGTPGLRILVLRVLRVFINATYSALYPLFQTGFEHPPMIELDVRITQHFANLLSSVIYLVILIVPPIASAIEPLFW